MQHSWPTAPPAVRAQVTRIAAALDRRLGGALIGLYLHGSLAMGCFNPARSDLDLLAVVREPLDRPVQLAVARDLLAASGTPVPLEMSVLAWSDLHPWRHPSPYDLHVHESYRVRFERGNEELPLSTPDQRRLDGDLAAHITHLRDRGVCLRGAPIAEVFPAVPPEDYAASILSDYDDARDTIADNPVYGVLNLARVWRHLEEGALSSKEEGGVWALDRVPSNLRSVVAHALAEYRGLPHRPSSRSHLENYAAFVDRRVAELQSAPPRFVMSTCSIRYDGGTPRGEEP